MHSLARFQESFTRGLISASPMPGLYSAPAFAVYRNTWRKALADALADAYPVVAQLIGPETFQALALQYVGKRAAPSPILADFGVGFADFIAAHPLDEELPYLADIARLERLTTEAHLAADADPLDCGGLSELIATSQDEHVALHPAARFGWFETPAVTIWDAHQEPGQFGALAPNWVPEGALVTRPAGRVVVSRIGHGAFRLLLGIQAGASLRAAAEAEAAVDPDADIVSTLLLLAEQGALTIISKRGPKHGHQCS